MFLHNDEQERVYGRSMCGERETSVFDVIETTVHNENEGLMDSENSPDPRNEEDSTSTGYTVIALSAFCVDPYQTKEKGWTDTMIMAAWANDIRDGKQLLRKMEWLESRNAKLYKQLRRAMWELDDERLTTTTVKTEMLGLRQQLADHIVRCEKKAEQLGKTQ